MPLQDFDICGADILRAASSLKRQFIQDLRGVPPASLVLHAKVAEACVTSFQQLLARDSAWSASEEIGYVKQNVKDSCLPTKLRGVLPNSTGLRIASTIALHRVSSFLDEYSKAEHLQQRVLGGSRGGQPIDIAFTGKLVLQCLVMLSVISLTITTRSVIGVFGKVFAGAKFRTLGRVR